MKQQNNRYGLATLWLGVAVLALSASAQAAPVVGASAPQSAVNAINDASALPAPDVTPYMGDLEKLKRMQRENLEIKQQLEQDKLRAQLATLRGQQLGEGASPYVLALTGAGKARHARLMVPGFGELTVARGDALPNGWRIDAINDHVVLARQADNTQVQLPFYAPH